MKNNRVRIKKIAIWGLCTSLTLILSYLEYLLPPLLVAVPGIKLGLPNIVIVFVLYRFGLRSAATVSMVRLLISSILFGTLMTFAYSLAGAILSLVIMYFLKKTELFSINVVSIAGGISHNIGQVIVAILLLNTPQIAYYAVVLAVTGTISGLFIGLCGGFMVKRLAPDKF